MKMKREDLIERLDRIVGQITAKGHPMQEFSSLKMALLDVIEVMKDILKSNQG
ncbi:MAG: hypothetical protein JXA24_00710 [Proteobacteria bacterium]|nr:hypothetical protein [Pseudomonadota bacterium]